MPVIMEMEIRILRFLQTLRNPSLDLFSHTISDIPFLIMLWAIIFSVIAVLHRDKINQMLLSVPFALIINRILVDLIFKNLVTRTRPYLVLEDIEYIGPQLTDYSFPSGHVTVTTALVFLAVFFEGGFIGPGIVFILLMCFSRIYNGVHWPLDTVGGLFFGAFIAFISLKLTKTVLSYREKMRIRGVQSGDEEKFDFKVPDHPLEGTNPLEREKK
jgi:membrane-associated phospholipid phosphatase